MGSRSKKLKTMLAVDLIILAIVIPGYFYVESQIAKPASFQVTDFVLETDWVRVGEPLQISVNVTNIGELPGNPTVTLVVDGVDRESETVELGGGECKTVVFTFIETVEGNYTVTIGVKGEPIEAETKTFRVTMEQPSRPAKLELSNLVTSRKEAQVGESITISVTATNVGDEPGEFALELFVNNQKTETKTVQLDGGEAKSVQFEVVEDAEGDYEVRVGALSASFKVTSEAQSVKPAEFQVTDLTINPTEVIAGEPVEISVTVTNVGEATGTYTVNLQIDGEIRDSQDVTLAGQAAETVEFELTETNAGSHTVMVDSQSGTFTVESLAPPSPNTKLKRLVVTPYEVWAGETVTIRAIADNLAADEESTLQVRLFIEKEAKSTKAVTLEPGATDVPIEFVVTAEDGAADGNIEGYSVEVVNLGNQTNKLAGYFQVAPDGFHTLTISRSGGGSTPMIFTLDGVEYETPYRELLPVGEYSISTDKIVELATGVVEFSHWNDGVENESRTFVLDKYTSLIAHYIVISGYASCPSLYVWNGTDYVYITEVSNAGWLGYIDYINEDGEIVFGGGNPWDHIKLEKTPLQPRNGTDYDYYDVVLFQQWDEIFYLDTAYLVAVDHPSNVDVYSSMVNYINKGFYGQIYSVNKTNLLTPAAAINEKGEDVLPQIAELDGVFTPASNGLESPSWDNMTFNQLTLDLGDLSGAPEIKLVINGMVDWGPPEPYYKWIDQFKEAAAEGLITNSTEVYPPPIMEVMDAEGNWIQVPQGRQMPIPGDYVPRTFAVDLNGLFPEGISQYKIRITNFWNVTFDYIGIDISPQADITVHEILPVATLEPLDFGTVVSKASGNFTKYGDVTPLLLEADDKFVIGMQGDKVVLKFPTTDLPPLEEGMERSFFMFVACWFKDAPGNWGYGFDFTVDPLPFQAMSGFPYPPTESYPTSPEYMEYLAEWNTRAVNLP